jgi:hypothetical protein
MTARTAAAVGALLLAASAAAGCTHKAGGTAARTSVAPPTAPASGTRPTGTAHRAAGPRVDPLTGGKPSANPVIAVKIDDTGNGRPQRGIDRADIVYIEQVEGGLTRLVAVFHTVLPVVEPVRSTRANDPELLAQYGPIGYVAAGGSRNPLQVLRQSSLRASVALYGPGLSRDGSRTPPYNLVANLPVLAKILKAPRAKGIGFTWSASAKQAAHAPAGYTVQTTVGSTPVEFRWKAKLHRYARVIGGVEQHAADGTLITTPNVVVQFCKVTTYWKDIDVNHNPAKWSHTVGSGKVIVFRNGHRITGTWSRPTLSSGTTLRDASGSPIALAPGGAWVVLVANGTSLQ